MKEGLGQETKAVDVKLKGQRLGGDIYRRLMIVLISSGTEKTGEMERGILQVHWWARNWPFFGELVLIQRTRAIHV